MSVVISKRRQSPVDCALRWFRVVPEVGDRRGWLVFLLLRLPALGAVLLPIVFAMFMALPIGLGVLRLGRHIVWIAAVSYVFGLLGGWASAGRMWLQRREALRRGALPYAAIRVDRDRLRVKFRASRVSIAWTDVISADADDAGFELLWRPDGRLFGVHVSLSQSSLLPSGDLADDQSMAAWINEIVWIHGSGCGVRCANQVENDSHGG